MLCKFCKKQIYGQQVCNYCGRDQRKHENLDFSSIPAKKKNDKPPKYPNYEERKKGPLNVPLIVAVISFLLSMFFLVVLQLSEDTTPPVAGAVLSLFITYFAYRISKAVWSNFDHSTMPANATLCMDAIITNVSSEQVKYIKNGAKYKTTVCFSDGFTFISHQTDREDSFFTYKISVDRNAIIENAIEAHERAFKKQGKRGKHKRY